jgi:hypothetical protein
LLCLDFDEAAKRMSAIEYGSYYWCVVLERPANDGAESVHLHADEMEIDQRGTLLFRSAGRRPAGSDPQPHNGAQSEDGKNQSNGTPDHSAKAEGTRHEKGDGEKKRLMTYVAFAPGTWVAVYAAKLTDGSAAAVEHWNVPNGKAGWLAPVPPNSGAKGYLKAE